MILLFLDTETTGTEKEDRLCQVCYSWNSYEYQALYRPPLKIKTAASAVHHITNRMVEDQPPFQGSHAYHTLKTLEKTAVLVAHNARFDLDMLEREGIHFSQYIDTLKVARFLDAESELESHSLQYLRYYHDVEIEAAAHDAAGDVRVLIAIFELLLQQLMELELIGREAALVRMLDISTKPTLFKRFGFGKHKGRLISEVAASDRNYLFWLYREKTKEPEGEEDWLFTLNTYLGNSTP